MRNEREVDLIRANLALNGMETVAKANTGKIESMHEKQQLQKERYECFVHLSAYLSLTH